MTLEEAQISDTHSLKVVGVPLYFALTLNNQKNSTMVQLATEIGTFFYFWNFLL